MIVSFQKSKHCNTLCEWLEEHKKKVPNQDLLPSTGFVYENNNGQPMAMVLYYLTNSNVLFFEWLTANPRLEKDIRPFVVNSLCEQTIEWAKNQGYHLMLLSHDKGLHKRFKKMGFVDGQKDLTLMYHGG